MQSGAFELSDGSSKVVLKWSEDPGWAHRVFRAAELVRKARAAGYPTPAWLAVDTTSAGSLYQLQEYVDGTPLVDATSLDLDVAETTGRGGRVLLRSCTPGRRPSVRRHLRSRRLCERCGLRRRNRSLAGLPSPVGRGAAAAPAGRMTPQWPGPS